MNSKTLNECELDQLSNVTPQEKRLRKGLLFLGALVLVYIYSDSLMAQQASQQRISIIHAADFPSDI